MNTSNPIVLILANELRTQLREDSEAQEIKSEINLEMMHPSGKSPEAIADIYHSIATNVDDKLKDTSAYIGDICNTAGIEAPAAYNIPVHSRHR